MQKDVHFYLTYALARKAGIDEPEAKTIAWADQYTDDLTEAQLYGIQTQCHVLGNWSSEQIQMSVLVPFHFIPGDDAKWPWKTTKNSTRARALVESAVKSADPLRLGIALHGLQDTFSHQGFSGWCEDQNACYPWYYVKSGIPNVGHAEMRAIPDMIGQIWIDPHTQETINNKLRAMGAAKETFRVLAGWAELPKPQSQWKRLEPRLRKAFKLTYDNRKGRLRTLSGDPKADYSEITKRLANRNRPAFIRAASDHLAEGIRLFQGLPRAA